MTKTEKVCIIAGLIFVAIIVIVQMLSIRNLQKTISLYGKTHVNLDDLHMMVDPLYARLQYYEQRIENLECSPFAHQGCQDIDFMRADPYCQIFYTVPGRIDSINYKIIFRRK